MTTRPVTHLFPRGTCKSTPFYFRGKDPLTEPEYLTKELSIVKEEYRRAKKELQDERAKFDKANSALTQRDGYTVALASALGENSYNTEYNAYLRNKLADLTTKIEGTERNIKFYRDQQDVSLVSGLLREKAYYHAEIEDLRLEILQGIENIKNGKAKLGMIVSSREYSSAESVQAEYASVRSLHNHLRNEMNTLFKEFTAKNPNKNTEKVRKPEISNIRTLHEAKQKLSLSLSEIQHEKYYTDAIAKYTALSMIDQIESMNQVLVSLGGEELNTDELRSHFQLAPISKQQNDIEEEQVENKSLRPRSGIKSTRRQKQATVRPKTSMK